jgi:hypothetical protein
MRTLTGQYGMIQELAAARHVDISLIKLASKGDRTLAECFKLFDVIRTVTTNHATVRRVTREVIEDFQVDNVAYRELRTTPKVTLGLVWRASMLGTGMVQKATYWASCCLLLCAQEFGALVSGSPRPPHDKALIY